MFSFCLAGEGRKQLQVTLRLCSSLDTADDIAHVKDWLTGTWFNLAMVDYPYPASFLEPLPAFPVEVRSGVSLQLWTLWKVAYFPGDPLAL